MTSSRYICGTSDCFVCGSIYLLLVEFLLDFLFITGVVDYRSGQLHLYVRQPGTEAAHFLFQLLNSHEGLPQLLHPDRRVMSQHVITMATVTWQFQKPPPPPPLTHRCIWHTCCCC